MITLSQETMKGLQITGKLFKYIVIQPSSFPCDTLYDAHCNQVGDADLEIGQDARVLAVAMEEDGQHREVQAFFDHVRLFF